MRKKDLFLMANQNLWRRKARTILTCLGVIIGTASIVVMISLGIGLRISMEQSMAQWGSLNIINVHPGMQWDESGNPTGEEKRMTDETVAELAAIPGVTAVSPQYNIDGEAKLGRKEGYLNIVGLDPAVMGELEFSVEHGRLLAPEDRFAIIAGSQVINNFWDERAARRGGMMMDGPQQQDPAELLDQRIQLTIRNQAGNERKQNFFVVGILDEKNMDRSWQVYASIHDVKRLRDFMMKGANNTGQMGPMAKEVMYSGSGMMVASTVKDSPSRGSRKDDRSNDYDSIMVRAKDVAQTKEVSQELRDRGFNAWSMADSLKDIENVSRTMQAILGGIGGITLFVAALGITNTMVMSIYERTREIGIMKVIGASFADVRSIFLTEAALIGLFGGIIGLGFSYGASQVVNKIGADYIQQGMMMGGPAANISVIPAWLAAFAVVFSIFIGLAAGLYPASRAIKVSPIVAIRNE
ncbi:MAG TPA: ABC transporter permease [Firmicutes bacterium]|jgi:putative ABC transport system permease protein|nr:ABC transporter permease [Bacillota bacterium]